MTCIRFRSTVVLYRSYAHNVLKLLTTPYHVPFLSLIESMGFSTILSSLQENPYFGAGFGLVGVGAGLALLRKVNQAAMIAFRRNCMVTLEVSSRDKSYQWLLQWITKHASHTKHLSAETTFEQLENGSVRTKFDFVPSPGVHYFWYGRSLIKVERNRENQSVMLNTNSPWESVTLTSLGTNRNMFLKILEKARQEALLEVEGMTLTYVASGNVWNQFGHPRKKRPLESVILNQGLSERVLTDIRDFIGSPEWYMNRGIPYRRGYLLYGPPGCGKSSFITALAGELEFNISILNLSDRSLTDDRLNYLLNMAPQQTIILLEDIDAAFVSREDTQQMKSAFEGLSRVTFSGLLNTLDGVASTEARIVFMTTNYLERLDPALIRPGRVDLKVEIGYATKLQMEQLFQRFYPEVSLEKSRHFAQLVADREQNVSMAQIQGYFLQHKSDPDGVMTNIDKIWH